MTNNILLLPILVPITAALFVFLIADRIRWGKETVALFAVLANLFFAIKLFGQNINYSIPWAGFGLEFVLRNYHFSSFIISAIAVFGVLITLYSCAFLRDNAQKRPQMDWSFFRI